LMSCCLHLVGLYVWEAWVWHCPGSLSMDLEGDFWELLPATQTSASMGLWTERWFNQGLVCENMHRDGGRKLVAGYTWLLLRGHRQNLKALCLSYS
jgi:hypothetical protein